MAAVFLSELGISCAYEGPAIALGGKTWLPMVGGIPSSGFLSQRAAMVPKASCSGNPTGRAQAFGIHLPFRRRFETPSAAGLALAVVGRKAEQAGEARGKFTAEHRTTNILKGVTR